MTPEQLDKIENRQAAAMWIGGPTAAFAQDTPLLVKALREAKADIERYKRALAQQEDLVKHFEPRAYSACLLPPEGCQCAGCDYRREWERA